MWLWRGMIKKKWTDRIRNQEVTTRIREERKLMHVLRKGKSIFVRGYTGIVCEES